MELSPAQADDWIEGEKGAGKAPATVRLWVSGASAFWTWLERRHAELHNPFRGTRSRLANRPRRPLAVLSEVEFREIEAAAEPVLPAAVVLMAQGGLRIGALPGLALSGEHWRAESKGREQTALPTEPGAMSKKTYKAGNITAVRKHPWMPCILARRMDDGLDNAEAVALLRRCYFMDYFTEAEWRAILGKEVAGQRTHKFRVKRKAAGWLMAMARLAKVRPDWYGEAVEQACREYEELIDEPMAWGILPIKYLVSGGGRKWKAWQVNSYARVSRQRRWRRSCGLWNWT